jgi:UDP-3-O-[3-hydroxymyristoyl] glucosamine N-acyltransferase
MTVKPTAFIQNKALVGDGVTIGAVTRVWGFTHLLAGAQVSDKCNICEQVFIEGDVVLGDGVTVKCGEQLWDALRIEDGVFIGPNVTFTNDPFPRNKQYPDEVLKTIARKVASIGEGDSDPSRHHDWPRRDDGCGRRGHKFSARYCCGTRQSSAAAALAGGCAQ